MKPASSEITGYHPRRNETDPNDRVTACLAAGFAEKTVRSPIPRRWLLWKNTLRPGDACHGVVGRKDFLPQQPARGW